MPSKKGRWLVQAWKGGFDEHDKCYSEVEVSVVHSSDTHGQKSYGWPSSTKIILDLGDSYTKVKFATAVRLAHVLAEHLNR